MKINVVLDHSPRRNVIPLHARAPSAVPALPDHAARYPELRYMGSKKRLLPWIHEVLTGLDFETALDPFSGTGCVAYMMKAMGRRVIASDFLNFSTTIARATVENNHQRSAIFR
jgi:adenine-specific DNA-methyltransferase